MEAASKKKRGRPAFRRDLADFSVKPVSPHIKTARHRQNLLLGNNAVVSLRLLDYAKAVQSGEEPTGEVANAAGFVWLCDYQAAERGKRGAIKHAILTELGRLLESHGLDSVRVVAARLCEVKPTVKEGAAMVRRFRLDKAAPASAEDLSDTLCKAIDDYRAVHRDLIDEDVLIAVVKTWDAVKSVLGGEAEDTPE